MLELAAAEPFREVCGLLFGKGDQIDVATPTINTAPNTALNFEIDPAALITALRAEREGGPRLLGYFHSHPNGLACPSATDQAMAEPDNRIWIIIASGHMTAWRGTNAGLTELVID